MSRNKKRKRDFIDEVDDILEKSQLELEGKELIQKSASSNPLVNVQDYFSSPEDFKKNQPTMDETVLDCLVRRIKLLGEGASNDDVLASMCPAGESGNITNKGMTHLRMQFMYLRKAYELAIQFMNKKTWKQCCEMTIQHLDIGKSD